MTVVDFCLVKIAKICDRIMRLSLGMQHVTCKKNDTCTKKMQSLEIHFSRPTEDNFDSEMAQNGEIHHCNPTNYYFSGFLSLQAAIDLTWIVRR